MLQPNSLMVFICSFQQNMKTGTKGQARETEVLLLNCHFSPWQISEYGTSRYICSELWRTDRAEVSLYGEHARPSKDLTRPSQPIATVMLVCTARLYCKQLNGQSVNGPRAWAHRVKPTTRHDAFWPSIGRRYHLQCRLWSHSPCWKTDRNTVLADLLE